MLFGVQSTDNRLRIFLGINFYAMPSQNKKSHTERVRLELESKELRGAITEKTVGYIVAALGLVAGLAWNEAVKSAIDRIFPTMEGGLLAQFLYAVIITLIVVILSVYLLRFSGKNSDSQKKK